VPQLSVCYNMHACIFNIRWVVTMVVQCVGDREVDLQSRHLPLLSLLRKYDDEMWVIVDVRNIIIINFRCRKNGCNIIHNSYVSRRKKRNGFEDQRQLTHATNRQVIIVVSDTTKHAVDKIVA